MPGGGGACCADAGVSSLAGCGGCYGVPVVGMMVWIPIVVMLMTCVR
jgi:hypothetical protein